MNLLVATDLTQGARRTDMFHATAGELVRPSMCGRPTKRECAECRRSFVGIDSGQPTTTALVAALDLDRDDLVTSVRSYAEPFLHMHDDEEGWARLADDLLVPGDQFPVGTVLEVRRGHLAARYPR